MEGDEVARNNALVAFYFRANPDLMDDDEWCSKVEQINWVLRYTGVITETGEIPKG